MVYYGCSKSPHQPDGLGPPLRFRQGHNFPPAPYREAAPGSSNSPTGVTTLWCLPADARCVVYARVSSGDQLEDLGRQVGRVVEWATQQGYRPDEVVKEIGSGLKGNRRQLRRIVGDPTVGMIIGASGAALPFRL